MGRHMLECDHPLRVQTTLLTVGCKPSGHTGVNADPAGALRLTPTPAESAKHSWCGHDTDRKSSSHVTASVLHTRDHADGTTLHATLSVVGTSGQSKENPDEPGGTAICWEHCLMHGGGGKMRPAVSHVGSKTTLASSWYPRGHAWAQVSLV